MIPHPAIGNARWMPVESLKRDGELFNLQVQPLLARKPPLNFPRLPKCTVSQAGCLDNLSLRSRRSLSACTPVADLLTD